MGDPAGLVLPLVILFLLSPFIIVGVLWMLVRRFGGRTLRVFGGSAVVATVFAPGFVFVGDMPVPVPLLVALLNTDEQHAAIGPAVTLASVFLFWAVLSGVRLIRPLRWPEKLRTPKALGLCALAPILLAAALVTLVALSGDPGPAVSPSQRQEAFAGLVLWISTVEVGWNVLLLIQTRQLRVESTSRLWALISWLTAGVLMGGVGWVLGFGLGIFTR
jgi:hypothetical protein